MEVIPLDPAHPYAQEIVRHLFSFMTLYRLDDGQEFVALSGEDDFYATIYKWAAGGWVVVDGNGGGLPPEVGRAH